MSHAPNREWTKARGKAELYVRKRNNRCRLCHCPSVDFGGLCLPARISEQQRSTMMILSVSAVQLCKTSLGPVPTSAPTKPRQIRGQYALVRLVRCAPTGPRHSRGQYPLSRLVGCTQRTRTEPWTVPTREARGHAQTDKRQCYSRHTGTPEV